MCHVCFLSLENTTGANKMNIGEPKQIKKVISLSYNPETGDFNGLPPLWADLLNMPLKYQNNDFQDKQTEQIIESSRPRKKF
mmetsp:Transcript_19204/g.18343  ORF Transcript_19204/g.18343 Transcript_19204/m.18343 type:complete len:82 (-) Transcript_19204:786-1031(-)